MAQALAVVLILIFMLGVLAFVPPSVVADTGDPHFLVLDAATCTDLIATEDDCWSHSSGGLGDATVPDSTNAAILDGNSGAGTGNIDADLTVLSWCADSACNGGADFTGTIVVDAMFLFRVNGDFTNAGTLTIDGQMLVVDGDWNSAVGTVDGYMTAGDGFVTMASALAGGMDFFTMTLGAGTTLSQVTIIGDTGDTGDTFSVSLADATAMDLTRLEIEAAEFDAGTANINFLDVGGVIFVGQAGRFAMDGVTGASVSAALGSQTWIEITDSTGALTGLTSWDNALVEWQMSGLTVGATLNFNVWGLTTGFQYELYENDVLQDTQTANANGAVVYMDTAGSATPTWSVEAIGTPPPPLTNPVYAVLDDAGCTPANLATDAGCWAATSGGVGGSGVPDATETAVLDANSGATAATVDAAMSVLGWCSDFDCSANADFAGAITVPAGITLTTGAGGVRIAGTFNLNGALVLNEGPLTGGMTAGAASSVTMQEVAGGGPASTSVTSNGDFETLNILGQGTFTVTLTDAQGDVIVNNLYVEDATFDAGNGNVLLVQEITLGPGGIFAMDGVTGPAQPSLPVISWITIHESGTPVTGNLGSLTQWTRAVVQWDIGDTGGPVDFIFDMYMDPGEYRLLRNGAVVDTQDSDDTGRVTFVQNDAGAAGNVIWRVQQTVAGGPPLQDGPAVPSFCAGNTLTLRDNRPEAANGVLWIWTWGDGTRTSTPEPEASHTYATRDVYTVTIAVQDASGRITSFSGNVDMAGVGCDVGLVAQLIGPFLLALLIILAITLLIQLLVGRRPQIRRPLIVAIVILTIVLGVFIYYGWNPVLPGGVEIVPQ